MSFTRDYNDPIIQILMSPAANPHLGMIAFTYLLDQSLPSPLLLVKRLEEYKEMKTEADPDIFFFLNEIGKINVKLLKKIFPDDFEYSWEGYLAYSKKVGPLLLEKIDALFKKYSANNYKLEPADEDQLRILVKLYAQDPTRIQEIRKIIHKNIEVSLFESNPNLLKKANLFLQHVRFSGIKFFRFKQTRISAFYPEPIWSEFCNLIYQDRIKKLEELFPSQCSGIEVKNESAYERLHNLVQAVTPELVRCIKFYANTDSLTRSSCQLAGIPVLAMEYMADLIEIYCEQLGNNNTIKHFYKNWLSSHNSNDVEKMVEFIQRGSYFPAPEEFPLLSEVIKNNQVPILQAILKRVDALELIKAKPNLELITSYLYKNMREGNIELTQTLWSFLETNSLTGRSEDIKIQEIVLSQQNPELFDIFARSTKTIYDYFDSASRHQDRDAIQFLLKSCQDHPFLDSKILLITYKNLQGKHKDLLYEIISLLKTRYNEFKVPFGLDNLDVAETFKLVCREDDLETFLMLSKQFSLNDIQKEQKDSKNIKKILEDVLKEALMFENFIKYPQAQVAAFLLNTYPQLNNYALLLCVTILNKNNFKKILENPHGETILNFYKKQILFLLSKVDDISDIINSLQEMIFDKEIYQAVINKSPKYFIAPQELLRSIHEGPTEKMEMILAAVPESKEFNINSLVNGRLIFCEAVEKNINLANKLLCEFNAKCSPAIFLMIKQHRVDLFVDALQLQPFKEACQSLRQELMVALKDQKEFLLALAIHGIDIGDKKLEKNEKRLSEYHKILQTIDSKTQNPTEKVLQFLLKSTWGGFAFFSPAKNLLNAIEKNPQKIEDIIKDEIRNACIKKIPDVDYFNKLLLIQNILHSPSKASIKKLENKGSHY